MATKKAGSKGTKKSSASKKGTGAKKATKKAVAKKTIAGKCVGWQAVQDNMPPLPSRLYVTGRCTFPTHGYKVTLKEAVPQGIVASTLILVKTVTPPKGPVIQTPQTIDVRYDKKKATIRYNLVTILPDGINIKVQQVF
jgi:hypothetical protein